MKAFEISEFGINALQLVDRPEPRPGVGQVLVKIRAASLNYRDLLVIKGQYNPRMPLPRIPLSDGAGEVIEVGSEVTRFRIGDRVVAAFMQTWLGGPVTESYGRSALGGAIDGVLAEFALFNEEGLLPIPRHLSFEEAATLPCAGVTAWNAITGGGTRSGDSVLVIGTGGVSLFALQFAQNRGARVIVLSGSNEKLEKARQLGASGAINYKTTPDWDQRVLELTGGRGVDHIVEVGGAGTLQRSLNAVRVGGRISLIGVLAPAPGAASPSLLPVIMKAIQIQGVFVGSREMFEVMNQTLSEHPLKPILDRVFPFSEIKDALHYMESAAHFGKISIRFEGL